MESKTSVELLVVLVVERAGESSTAFAEVGAVALVALVVLVAEAEAAEVSVVPGHLAEHWAMEHETAVSADDSY